MYVVMDCVAQISSVCEIFLDFFQPHLSETKWKYGTILVSCSCSLSGSDIVSHFHKIKICACVLHTHNVNCQFYDSLFFSSNSIRFLYGCSNVSNTCCKTDSWGCMYVWSCAIKIIQQKQVLLLKSFTQWNSHCVKNTNGQ